jgi:hypothetical protein
MLGKNCTGFFMRGLVLKAVMMAAVILGAMNYMGYLPTDRSRLPVWLDKTLVRLVSLKEDAVKAVKNGTREEGVSQVIYKWTDAKGVLQYSNTPPPKGVDAEVVKVDPNANLIPAVTVPQKEKTTPVPVVDHP